MTWSGPSAGKHQSHGAAKKTAAKKAPARKAPSKKAAGKKAAGKKAAGKKTAAQAPARVAIKKGAAKAPSAKTAAKRLPAAKAPVKRPRNAASRSTAASRSRNAGQFTVTGTSGRGFQVELRAANGKLMMGSATYATKQAALRAIEAVRRAARRSTTDDKTAE